MSKKLAKNWKWVLAAVVVLALALVSREGDGEAGTSDLPPEACQVEVTADVLNVRAGPGVENASVEKLSEGAVVAALPETSNGFRRIGDGRWVAEEFVRTSGNC